MIRELREACRGVMDKEGVVKVIKQLQFISEIMLQSYLKVGNHALIQMLIGFESLKFFHRVRLLRANQIYVEEGDHRPVRAPIQELETLSDQTSETQEPPLIQHPKPKIMTTVAEIIMMLRPLLTVLTLRVCGENSYIPYFLSLLLELVVNLIHTRTGSLSPTEKAELQARRKKMPWRYMFKKPIYHHLKAQVLVPLLAILLPKNHFVSRFILSTLDIQASTTLNL